MSILIKDLEMPTHCMDCPFMVSRDNDDCILQSEEANGNIENWEQMKDGCPLVSVPPHGRLVDADELFKEMERKGWFDNADRDIAEDLVLAAPTIIQAEESA